MLKAVGHKFQRSTGKETPKISTSSLPDIIFILLFFFMMVTVMRDSSLKVKNVLPSATEVQKMEKKSLVNFMYVGKPVDKYVAEVGTAPRLQLDDQFADPEDIGPWVQVLKSNTAEELKNKLIFSLKADKEVTMGLISDIKQEMRKAEALKLLYSTQVRSEVY
ncbi:MAG: biopolymer transporter ExbD [Chitinophagales bacterium]